MCVLLVSCVLVFNPPPHYPHFYTISRIIFHIIILSSSIPIYGLVVSCSSSMLYGDADDGSPTPPPASSSVFELLQLNVVSPFNAHPHTYITALSFANRFIVKDA